MIFLGCDRWDPFPVNEQPLIPQNPVHIKPSDHPLIYIIKNEKDSLSKATTLQIAAALNYAKIPYSTFETKGDTLSIPESVQTICLTNFKTGEVDSTLARQLVRFVGSGHSLIIAAPDFDASLFYLEGIDSSMPLVTDTTARGMAPLKKIFPGYPRPGDTFAQNTIHGGISSSSFRKKVKVLATAANKHTYPVILKNRVGSGNVFLYNTYSMSSKEMRGLLFSNLIRTLQGIPYNVTDIATIFLDDFPEAVYKDTMPPIKQEYNISSAEFVKRKWWPDMKALADSFGLKYTAMLTDNYNSIVVPPFNFNEWTGTKLKINGDSILVSPSLAHEVLRSPHELGYHGYNHISLLSNRWLRQDFMTESINAARKRWYNDNLGLLPVTYVPPNDFIDSTGLVALSKGMPSIRYICSTYIGDVSRGSGREFSVDPYVPAFFDYPRITDGYYNTGPKLFDQHSLEVMTGIWTHFLHPDDVYDIPGSGRNRYNFSVRNPQKLGWQTSKDRDYGLYDMFRKRIEYTKKQYPLLRFKTVKNAIPNIYSWRYRQIQYRSTGDSMSVDVHNETASQQSTDWYMYVPANQSKRFRKLIVQQADTVARSKIWNGYLYQFRTHHDTLHFPRINKEIEKNQKMLATNSVKQLMQQYQRKTVSTNTSSGGYTEQDMQRLEKRMGNPKQVSEKILNEYVNAALSLNRVPSAIEKLKKKLTLSKNWSDMTLVRLLTFLGWQSESNQIWDILDTRWKHYPDESTLQIKDEVVNKMGWPDVQTQEHWQKREFSIHPNKTALLRDVVTQNGGKESWPRVKSALKKLIRKYPESDTLYALAIQRSFYNEPTDSTLAWLQQFPSNASAQLKPFSDDIAWLYADRRDYVRAEMWAERAAYLDPQSQLYWLITSGRYNAFQNKAAKMLERHPRDDSLRVYAGTTLLDAGYDAKVYPILYPLFKTNNAPAVVQSAIRDQVQAMSWSRQKQFYNHWPAFFNRKMIHRMDSTGVRDESFTVIPHSSITKDNYNNEVARAGINASWGYTPRYTHTVNTEEVRVQSPVGSQRSSEYLQHLGYQYEHRFNDGNITLSGGAGAVYSNRYNRTFPNLTLGFSRSGSQSYLSSNLGLSPVLTTTAIQNDIRKVELNIYREDNLFNRNFRTAVSGVGRAYTDNVQSFEASFKGYIPISLGQINVNPVGQISYSDATQSIPSGIPYWTPNRLRIYGAGVQLQGSEELLPLNFTIEGMHKYNSDTGYYNVVEGNIGYRINNYLQIQLDGRLSTSRTYRSNTLGLSIRFNVPGTAPKFNISQQNLERGSSYGNSNQQMNPSNNKRFYSSKTAERTRYSRHKSIVIGQIERQQSAGSLYNLPVIFKSVDDSQTYHTRTYYNGEFYAKLPPGNYSVTLDTTFSNKGWKVMPDEQSIAIGNDPQSVVPDTVHFVIQGKNEAVASDSTRYVVRIKKVKTLSDGLKEIKQFQNQLEKPIRLQYQEADSSLWISSPLFDKQLSARKFEKILQSKIKLQLSVESIHIPYPETVTYFVQYASFDERAKAVDFLDYVQKVLPDRQSYINIDPVRGVYQILSGPYDKWITAKEKSQEAKQKKYLKKAFIQFSPSKETLSE